MAFSLSRSAGRLGIILSASLFLATTLSAQQTPVFHSQTELVQIPVSVMSADGALVRGLTRDDFRCTIDGHPVVIRNLDVVHAPRHLDPLIPTGRGVFSNQAAARPAQRMVLLIDYDHTPATDLPYLRLQLKKWFQQPLQPGVEVAIFALDRGLQVLQPFTDNAQQLEAVADHIVSFDARSEQLASVRRDLQLLNQFESQRMDPAQGPQGASTSTPAPLSATDTSTAAKAASVGLSDIEVGPIDPAGSNGRGLRLMQQYMERDQYAGTMQALMQLASLLDGIPGRKPVIWLTPQTSLEMAWNADSGFTSTLSKEAFARLNQADAGLFPLDLSGLGSTPNPFAQLSLRKVAHATGGHAFLNTNGFTGAFDRVAALTSENYVLSFVPPPADKGHPFRMVTVELAHPDHGVELLYRRQYLQPELAAVEAQHVTVLQAVRRAALLPLELGGIPLSARVTPEQVKQGAAVDAALVLRYADVLHDDLRGDGGVDFDFSCFRALMPMDQPGRVVVLPSWRFKNHLDAHAATQWRQQAAVNHSRIPVASGHLYLVRLIVRDNLTGRMGSVSFPVDTRTRKK